MLKLLPVLFFLWRTQEQLDSVRLTNAVPSKTPANLPKVMTGPKGQRSGDSEIVLKFHPLSTSGSINEVRNRKTAPEGNAKKLTDGSVCEAVEIFYKYLSENIHISRD